MQPGGQLDFAAVDDALPPAVLQSQVAGAGGQSVVQLPIAGNTVVVAYNLPGANATLVRFFTLADSTTRHIKFKLTVCVVSCRVSQVLNGTVLADIWQGKIAMWDDAALIELNPAMDLPHANITTVFGTNSSFDETSVHRHRLRTPFPLSTSSLSAYHASRVARRASFALCMACRAACVVCRVRCALCCSFLCGQAFARSLGSFSSDFAAAFTDMESLPPVLEGRSVGFASPRQRVDHVAVRCNSRHTRRSTRTAAHTQHAGAHRNY
jgi:hypothetical protein